MATPVCAVGAPGVHLWGLLMGAAAANTSENGNVATGGPFTKWPYGSGGGGAGSFGALLAMALGGAGVSTESAGIAAAPRSVEGSLCATTWMNSGP